MIRLKDVSKFYYQDGLIATGFTKVNLEFHIGEFVVITGESGSGKSSLLNVISGLDSYEEGEMYINGEETSHYNEEDYLNYRKKYVTNIFQNFNLVNSYTVYQNIELALLLNGEKKKDIKQRVLELIDLVDLKKFKNTKASKLSGGQKQRVAIARALAYDTPIIVADEPTGSLDSKQSKSILELLHKISKDKLVIVVTHNKKEIEEYATRLIRMHDGRLLENKTVEKINKDNILETKKIKSITLGSKIRLGLRNTFNIPIKFFLIFCVFAFISFSLVSEYGSMKMTKEDQAKMGYNSFFQNADPKRIVIKKNGNLPITEDDYAKIMNLNNVDYIEKNDLINDLEIYLYNDQADFYGNAISTSTISKVDVGRMPENANEVVVKGAKDYYFNEEILNKEFTLEVNYTNALDSKVKIVGLIYSDDFDYEKEFFMSKDVSKKISISLNEYYSTITMKLNETLVSSTPYESNWHIVPSNKVKEGEVLLPAEANGYCENAWCLNKTMSVNIKNIYFEDKIDLNITNTYNQNNFTSLTGIKKMDNYTGSVFINENDYNRLLNKDNYQSSVFVKDDKLVKETSEKISNLGFTTLNLKDSLYNSAKEAMQLFNIFELVVVVILIIGLFFISYFIIKIILKSRNVYFATIRTLGGTKKVSISLLVFELIFNATTAYLTLMLVVYLVNNNIIKFESFKNLLDFVTTTNYVLLYLILIFISILISLRYARKLFKESVIKTYGEKV